MLKIPWNNLVIFRNWIIFLSLIVTLCSDLQDPSSGKYGKKSKWKLHLFLINMKNC